MTKATRTRLSIYLSLLSAIVVTLFYMQLRTLRITSDEAAGYFDGCLQSLTMTAKEALSKQEAGKPVLREMILIGLKSRQVRKLGPKVSLSLERTERRLKRLGASEEITRTHRWFEVEFRSNAKSLNRRCSSLAGHYWAGLTGRRRRAQFREELYELVEFLEGREPELPDIQLDPLKLPHRLGPEAGLPCEEHNRRAGTEARVGVSEVSAEPLPDDLRETAEVRFSRPVRELVRKLGGSPGRMMDYVESTLEYEPYFGSLKGAERTVLEGAGNDFDLASLLISMLRCSGVPSRYVFGEVFVPRRELMGWMGGVKDAATAIGILGASGIYAVVLESDGDTVGVRMAHCWVEAFTDGTGWKTLDPSFRRYVHHLELDVSQDVVFDERTYMDLLRVQRGWKRILPVVGRRSAPVGSIPSPRAFYLDNIKDFIEARFVTGSISKALGRRTRESGVDDQMSELAPLETANHTVTFSEIPDSMRHRLSLRLLKKEGREDLSHHISTANLGSSPILLLYLPANQHVEDLAEAYGSMYAPPAYLLEVRPYLRVGGEVVATGDTIRLGESQVMQIIFKSPGRCKDDTVEIQVVAGAAVCPVLDYQQISEGFAKPYIDDVRNIMERGEDGEESALPDAEIIERFLHGLGIWYFRQLDDCNRALCGVLHLVNTREVSLQLLAYDVSVTYLFGVPYDVDMEDVFIDTYRIVNKPFSVLGDQSQRERFNVISGYESSFLMQHLDEHWFKRRSFCAVEALQMARQRGVPIHTVSVENAERVVPRLQLSTEMKERIRDMVEAGRAICVPQEELVIYKWQGIGYIAFDPVTGDGAYKVRRERDPRVLAPGSGRLIFEYSTVLIAAVAASWVTYRLRRRRLVTHERERRRTGGPPQ